MANSCEAHKNFVVLYTKKFKVHSAFSNLQRNAHVSHGAAFIHASSAECQDAVEKTRMMALSILYAARVISTVAQKRCALGPMTVFSINQFTLCATFAINKD